MGQEKVTEMQKKSKFLDIKLMIVALSAAITMGLWNLLSNSLLQSGSVAPSAKDSTSQTQPTTSEGFAPIPTLVDLAEYSTASQSVLAAPATSTQPSSLRSVAPPSQTIVQKNKPTINQPPQVVITINGGNNGNGGGSSNTASAAPVTTTKSS